MVRTKDALGTWEKPVLVLAGKGLIDSCPFWDEDGNAYIIHGYAKSRIGFKSHLGIFPMSWDGTKATGRIIFSTVDLRHSRRLRDLKYINKMDIIIFLPRQAV